MLKLKTANNFLLAAIVIINTYLILAPFYPKAYLWWQLHVNHQGQKLEKVVASAKAKPRRPPDQARTGEWLVIPKIALDTPIFEGPTVATANKGVWHRPKSAKPGNSNTVLAGHRFTYTQPKGIFYNLDKLATGDRIALFWNGMTYTYTVHNTKVVPPSDTDIEQPTATETLTLYTCTPLWSAKNRLVVTAVRSGNE